MKNQLSKNPAQLGLDASATVQPDFTGVEWYEEYSKRTEADGKRGP